MSLDATGARSYERLLEPRADVHLYNHLIDSPVGVRALGAGVCRTCRKQSQSRGHMLNGTSGVPSGLEAQSWVQNRLAVFSREW
jgi:hypothetical protein